MGVGSSDSIYFLGWKGIQRKIRKNRGYATIPMESSRGSLDIRFTIVCFLPLSPRSCLQNPLVSNSISAHILVLSEKKLLLFSKPPSFLSFMCYIKIFNLFLSTIMEHFNLKKFVYNTNLFLT